MKDSQRLAQFERVCDQLAGLIAKTNDPVAHRATAVALLHHKIPKVSWTGFYMLQGEELVIDVYQGPVACLVLAKHTGVCWAAIDRAESLTVSDVESFPGHIACDSRSKSEVVIPMFGPEGLPIGVLDVDSYESDRFDDISRQGFEMIVRLLEHRMKGREILRRRL
ncbi:MAG: GAF domain-containing protein [bacterium]|nr:GAF domain-containing protein [bacterium]